MRAPSSAFSLVELSIVLVILGLLVGGILAGQSLIHASELRKTSAEFTRYQTALLAFRDKYLALPGDMTNATSFWGDNSGTCPDASANGTPGTCNGDGDGAINVSTFVYNSTEATRAWQHLLMAGLVEGTYSGSNWPKLPGQNIPAATINPNAGYYFSSEKGWTAATRRSNVSLILGGHYLPDASQYLLDGALTPTDSWNLDTKMDDGNPGAGRFTAIFRTNAAGSTVLNDCITPSGHNAVPTTYMVDQNLVSCRVQYWLNL